ncbi:MAG: hypothetical protein IPK15_21455 [Verrucomicrobia bacterium]|nr:hypothetical protein [Verrucomicrobiota bacterium]
MSDEVLATGYFQRRIDQLVPVISPDVTLDKAPGVRTRRSAAPPTRSRTPRTASKPTTSPRASGTSPEPPSLESAPPTPPNNRRT